MNGDKPSQEDLVKISKIADPKNGDNKLLSCSSIDLTLRGSTVLLSVTMSHTEILLQALSLFFT